MTLFIGNLKNRFSTHRNRIMDFGFIQKAFCSLDGDYAHQFGLDVVLEYSKHRKGNPPPLPKNPTVAQMRNHNDEVAKEGKMLVMIDAALHDDVFIKILTLETTKKAWDKLKEEFQGSKRTK
ncbi:hypothetical protein CR513_04207, partial [Mucuna pruriens]